MQKGALVIPCDNDSREYSTYEEEVAPMRYSALLRSPPMNSKKIYTFFSTDILNQMNNIYNTNETQRDFILNTYVYSIERKLKV